MRGADFHGISPMISGDHREISVSLEAKNTQESAILNGKPFLLL
jgi:hypothetical protein